MKILVTFDNSGWYTGNPFTQLLPASFARGGACVFEGLHWLATPEIPFDVVNIQWPEYALPRVTSREEATEALVGSLKRMKPRAVIVATVHNELPHSDHGGEMRLLYESVYSICDGFVHMGRKSEQIVNRRFRQALEGKPSVLIPHGNYFVFGERIERRAAKAALGLPARKTALLVGAIRSPAELALARELIDAVISGGGQVIFASKMPRFSTGLSGRAHLVARATEEFAGWWRMLPLKFRRRVHVLSSPVSSDLMASLGSAADVVLIPRIQTLNSGNVPFAFTYGSVACGPDVGNVGEILRGTGNVTFDPIAGAEVLRDAVGRAFDLAEHGHGELNYAIALKDWSWDRIGAAYMDFFESLIQRRQVDEPDLIGPKP